jgi:two-component system, chemotaxis family, sensor kinase CheA
MIQDDDILQEFVVESVEHLADVESQLLEIEESGVNINHDLVNTVFRAIHSVKGAAGFLGLVRINELAHNLENVLNQVRNEELVPTHAVIDRLLRSADMLRTMVSNVDTSNEMDVSEQVEELKQILRGEPTCGTGAEQVADELQAVSTVIEHARIHVTEPAAERAGGECTEEEEDFLPSISASVRSANMPVPSKIPAEPKPATRIAENNVRVNVAILDRLMNLAGELVLGRNQLLQSVNSNSSKEHIATVAARLDQVTSELQEAIMQTRMQPVGAVFNRFPRVVRDLSAKLAKNCSLEIEGSEVEVDKTIIEAIGDPLTHLIRNAVDHGIEAPATRVAHGKRPEGTIHLRAFHQAGKVCIRIEDNGGGIDPARVKAKAVSNGLISEAEAASMSINDTLRLIFAPGFSTAAQITDVSGRGVGMDVVRTNIEQIGGTVDVESELDKGTSIHITLPLTLAIIPSMIVGSGNSKFAIPQTNIVELVRVPANEIGERIGAVQGAEVLRLRGALLPLIRLAQVFGMDDLESSTNDRGNLHIIVVETGQYRFGVAVDSLFDSEEIVVKPLGRQLRDLDYLAGATILGDGRVALILDIMGLAMHANLRSCEELLELNGQDIATHVDGEIHRMLLFNNSPSEQFAVPMACVSRIERTSVAQVHVVGGVALLPYRGATLPLIALEDHISVSPRQAELNHVFVIVFNVGAREIGLIAPILKDIRNVSLAVDDSAVCEPGVAGVFVLDEQPIRLLDMVSLVRQFRPEWLPTPLPSLQGGESREEPNKVILFAEDSSFFRRHVEQTLVEEGYAVVSAVDGQEAWEKLQTMDPLPAVVLTDVEMPRMSGLEFCRSIRSDERTRHLPVIALTSLASDADISRGKETGVDDYQVKLDRANLLASIANFTKRH